MKLFLLAAVLLINQAQMDNQLTTEEKKQGWKLLFDGHSMDHWRFYKDQENSDWSVENGTLHCKAGDQKNGLHADLISKEQYENFELSVDWKLAPRGNSGILYLVTEEYKQPYLSGPEYQLIDEQYYASQLEPWQHTGANYAMNVPTAMTSKPTGEWNHTRILVKQGHVEHWLNGTLVVRYELWNDEWKEKQFSVPTSAYRYPFARTRRKRRLPT